MAYIDKTALESISSLQRPGKPSLLDRVIDLFINDAPGTIDKITVAIEEENLEEVRINAHTLKSSCAYLGAVQLSSRLSELETAARAGNLLACIALSDSVEEDYKDAAAELKLLQSQAA